MNETRWRLSRLYSYNTCGPRTLHMVESHMNHDLLKYKHIHVYEERFLMLRYQEQDVKHCRALINSVQLCQSGYMFNFSGYQ